MSSIEVMSSAESSSGSTDEGFERSFNEPDVLYPLTLGKTKIFNDMVHPHLELPAICYKIINTPQFQRLRNLKQLGLCYHVYPSACHNRFEHCIGTSYLAGKYCKSLQKNQPELDINEKDILCLYIAGLCHDLGHGPFSHTWEHFNKIYAPSYNHESMSIRMIDYLIRDNALEDLFLQENLDETDLIFIKELILGHPIGNNDVFQGRSPPKHFLYEIVSNDKTKIDVDKFDYILRDCKQLNVTTAFDYERVIDNSRVFSTEMVSGILTVSDDIRPDVSTTIAYRKKIAENLEDLFQGRFSLHQKAYQHKVTRIIETMIMDGLVAAEPYFKVKASNGKEFSLSTAHEDITAFAKLTDSVFELILNYEAGGPVAQNLFMNICKRNLYRCLGYVSSPLEENVRKELEALVPNVSFISTKIDYGKGAANPLNEAYFFEKNRPNVLFHWEFPAPKKQSKCFIVLKNAYENSGEETAVIPKEINDNETEDTKLTSLNKTVAKWAKKHGILIETE